ncbi:acyltransferase family protein [Pseudomonas sp. SID14000]|uniref:acyltransferase family protein n=1 Tax=Pseudomonas sp. SID14000 TaxID=1986221 RepID=UPI000B3CC5C6|nr:acyltransferase family protein [Pseudomonas sp. SID14000]
MSTIRVDIQVLRGLAVLFVVLEHLAIPGFQYGYLGVDIFFVISGFLITSIVSKGLERDSFSFKQFYLRRAKRLLPASFVTIFATIIAAKLLLPPMQIESLKQQIIGALSFSTNFVLMSQAGYFDLESATKPLLHMWSLAVEEQFYFFVPALLAFTPAKHWRKLLIALAIVSFVGCLYLSASNQSAAFYLLPTRAWELLIGSIASMLVHSTVVKSVTSKLAIPAFAVLLVSPFVNSGLSHPGLDAVVVCFATAIVLLANHRQLNGQTWTLPIKKAGDISYSLYLVHWPIIAIANATISTESMTVKATLLAASLASALALYHLVEEPFRKMQYGFKPSLVVFPALTLALFGLSHAFLKVQSAEKIEKLFAPNYGLDRSCGTNIYKDTEKCRTSQDPKIIVWGDSYAMHNIPGMAQSQKIDIRQATRSSCAPFLNTAPNTKRSNFEEQARQCVGFNDSAFKFISETPTIKTVILAGSYGQYMHDSYESISFDANGAMQIAKSTPERAMKDMQVVVEKLKALGKQVVIIAPPPPLNNTIVSCIQGEMVNPSLNQSNKCLLDRKLFERSHKNVLNLMKYAETTLGAKVIYLSDVLCDANSCKTIIDGVPIYRDPGHLSTTGSLKLYEKMPNILSTVVSAHQS